MVLQDALSWGSFTTRAAVRFNAVCNQCGQRADVCMALPWCCVLLQHVAAKAFRSQAVQAELCLPLRTDPLTHSRACVCTCYGCVVRCLCKMHTDLLPDVACCLFCCLLPPCMLLISTTALTAHARSITFSVHGAFGVFQPKPGPHQPLIAVWGFGCCAVRASWSMVMRWCAPLLLCCREAPAL